ncbi:MAG: hypothetical protein RL748_170 [Pseudomonadota bacterium]|jgi:drug/metabolite transporter (DMT)-like permease
MQNLTGILLILLSALGFGSMALCAGLASKEGVDTFSLLALRFSIASLALIALARQRGDAWPTGGARKMYGLMGCVYAAMAWCYFSALHYAAPSTVTLVLFCFPVLVAIAAGVLKLDRFGPAEWLAVIASCTGLALMTGTTLSGGVSGFVLAFLAALCYASYIILGSKISTPASPIAASCLVLGSAAIIFSALALSHGLHLPHSASGWLAVIFLALFSTAVAIAAFVAGLKRVGPTLASILSTLEPVVTITLGIAFMGDKLQTNSLIGGAFILTAAIGLTLARMRRK